MPWWKTAAPLVVPSISMDPVWPYIPIFMVRVEIHIFTRNLQIYKWIDQTKHVGRVCRLPYFAFLQRYNFISPPFHGSIYCALDSSLSPLIGFTRVGREDRGEPWSPSSGYKVPKQLAEHSILFIYWKLTKISKADFGYFVWDVNHIVILLLVQIRFWDNRQQKEGTGKSVWGET